MDGLLNKDYAEGRKKKRSLKYRLWRRGYEVSKAIKLYKREEINTNKTLKVLDLGCADGLMIKKLSKEFNISATGIELSKDLYESAVINCPDAIIINSDINEIDFSEDEKFDLIICTAVLEHLQNPSKVVSKIFNLLSINGITVWTVPDPFWEKIATLVGHLDGEQHHHIPNIKELKKLANSNNLKVVKAKKFMFSPIGFPLEIKIERLLIKLRLSALMANQLLIAKK
tara:strand:+ start:120 stop:803 length:684 start_codon:yes stop_codon:yes gene_type:complete